MTNYTKKALIFATIELIIGLFLVICFNTPRLDTGNNMGSLFFALGFASILGFVYAIKSLKESRSVQKNVAICVNFTAIFILFCILFTVVIDIVTISR